MERFIHSSVVRTLASGTGTDLTGPEWRRIDTVSLTSVHTKKPASLISAKMHHRLSLQESECIRTGRRAHGGRGLLCDTEIGCLDPTHILEGSWPQRHSVPCRKASIPIPPSHPQYHPSPKRNAIPREHVAALKNTVVRR